MDLTKRQAEIVSRLADGMTAEEIAISLCRSVLTVRTQVKQACQRTNARNTAHLIAIAISRGWIAPLALALMLADLHGQTTRARQPVTTRQPITCSSRVGRRDLGSVLA
ncbi:helix-turn-helix transcriptional regulator [Halomonas eurihalina]|uniref:Helix-turn-helix transcriptional regulator n=1 Tax=Halomonas eurihalina TaxID=42566 RepID=A0A5D9DCS7_HALER|nr:helix-turn-helix domain-containing protein [Halomonas eurihalina]MDR5858186.1 helix-turn-helix domain-containing protein [Halomonas eurihalina]TZG41313.1 helix-turn-helix transcriptional regulator [Halomonas eurihalina]